MTQTIPAPAVPEPPSTPAPLTTSTPVDVYFENCAEARAAGAAPLLRGQPGYRAGLDRDGDGVACEPYRPRV
ncbi:excalibur calcium-binding domain-containing protein [Streptomyces melanogenes]|uniref:excalibur calcium-binding domain-containing protein n=1 Tax=Streptomyces melanogenes TaxID=67326 RepID=UPI0037B0C26A